MFNYQKYLKFNILEGGGAFFGTHSAMWFFHSAIPYLLLGWTPFLIYGVIKYTRENTRIN